MRLNKCEELIKSLIRHYPSGTANLINKCGNIPYDTIKNVEKIYTEYGISCSLIDGQIHIGNI